MRGVIPSLNVCVQTGLVGNQKIQMFQVIVGLDCPLGQNFMLRAMIHCGEELFCGRLACAAVSRFDAASIVSVD